MIDRESLIQMAANRQVRNGDEVWFQERWQAVGALPELLGRVGTDPWDAWEGDESGDDAPVPEPEEIEPEPLVEEPRRMVIRAPSAPARPTEVEPEAGSASGIDGDVPEEEAATLGQVIAFPAPRPRPALPAMPPNTPRSPAPLVRASRLIAFLVLGVAGLAIAWLWVLATGSTAGVQRGSVRPEATTTPTPLHPTTTADPSRELLLSLRARLPQEVQGVHKQADLGDAMLIELQNLETGVEAVDAVVTAWTGPKLDQPKEATVVVTFRDTQNLERDLGSFGLVLGRYMRAYSIRVPDARVVFHSAEGDVGRTIDSQTCIDLYNGRLQLGKFLEQ